MDDPAPQVLPAPAPPVPDVGARLDWDALRGRWRDSVAHHWARLLASIPGSRAYELRHLEKIIKLARSKYAGFDALSSVREEARRTSRHNVREYLRELAALEVLKEAWENVMLVAIMPLLFVALIMSPFVLYRWIPVEAHTVWGWVAFAYAYMLGISTVGLFVLLPFVALASTRLPQGVTIAIGILWLVPAVAVTVWWGNHLVVQSSGTPLGFKDFLVLASIVGLGSYIGTMIAVMLPVIVVLESWFGWRRIRRHPVAVIVNDLISILRSIEKSASHWTELGTRKHLLVRLEAVARCLEFDIPARLEHRDHLMNLWSSQAFARMATAIRELKRAIITPKSDSREYVMNILATSLVHAAQGDWDSFPRAELAPLSNAQRLSVIRRVLGTLLSASVPLAVLLIGERFQIIQLSESVRGYVQVGAMIWFIVAMLAALDPMFTAKISALSEVVNLIPIIGRGKKSDG